MNLIVSIVSNSFQVSNEKKMGGNRRTRFYSEM